MARHLGRGPHHAGLRRHADAASQRSVARPPPDRARPRCEAEAELVVRGRRGPGRRGPARQPQTAGRRMPQAADLESAPQRRGGAAHPQLRRRRPQRDPTARRDPGRGAGLEPDALSQRPGRRVGSAIAADDGADRAAGAALGAAEHQTERGPALLRIAGLREPGRGDRPAPCAGERGGAGDEIGEPEPARGGPRDRERRRGRGRRAFEQRQGIARRPGGRRRHEVLRRGHARGDAGGEQRHGECQPSHRAPPSILSARVSTSEAPRARSVASSATT